MRRETQTTNTRDWSLEKNKFLLYGRIRAPLAKPMGITIEYGRADEYAFIRRGSEHVSGLFRSMGLPHALAVHEGSHDSRLGWRLETALLPVVSDQLRHEP